MVWQHAVRWLTAAVLGGAVAGCAGGESSIYQGPATMPAAAGQQGSAVSRFQMPDTDPSAPPPVVAGPPNGQFAVRVRAKVNGVAILDEELRSAIYPFLMQLSSMPEPQRSARMKEVLSKALENLIDREVILGVATDRLSKNEQGKKVLEKLKASANKDFDKQVRKMKQQSGAKTDEDFKQMLIKQGQSLEGMRRQFQRMTMMNEYMRYLVSLVTDKIGLDDALEYYKQHPGEFQTYDNVKWQDIFILAAKHGGLEGARQLAASLLSRAQSGADFAELARQYDEGVSVFRNGEGYGQRRGEIKPPEAEPYLFDLKDGQIGPLVELPHGIHVIRLVKREYAGLMPFDEKTQSFILNKLKSEVAEREWKRIVKDFRRKAVIERDLSP